MHIGPHIGVGGGQRLPGGPPIGRASNTLVINGSANGLVDRVGASSETLVINSAADGVVALANQVLGASSETLLINSSAIGLVNRLGASSETLAINGAANGVVGVAGASSQSLVINSVADGVVATAAPSQVSREIARTLSGAGLTTTGASSTTNLAAATAGYIEYQFGVSIGNDWPVAGLREGAFPAGAFNFNLIQWGLLSLGTTIRVYENGVHAGGVTTTAAVGDVFAIERLADNSMRYLKNGVPFYTSAQNSSGGALEFGVNINEPGGSVKNARWNDGTIIDYQNVTGLSVTDTAIEATDWSFRLDSINTLNPAGDSGVLSGSATILNFDFFDNDDAIVVASYSPSVAQPLREYLLGTTSDIATTTNGAVESATTGGFVTFGMVEAYPDGSHVLVNQYTTTALYSLPILTLGTLAGTDFANIGAPVYTLPSADWASGNLISTGLALYGVDYIGETAYRVPLSVARDWATVGVVTSRDFTAIIGANNCRGIAANSDESEVIIATEANRTLYHFVLSIKGDLDSAVLAGSYQLPAANSTPGDICVRNGQINVSDYTDNIIYKYAA